MHPAHARGTVGDGGDVEDVVGAQAPGRFEPGGGRPDHEDAARAGQGGEDGGVQAHGPAALDHDGVGERDPGPLHGVETGRQAAASAHEVLRIEALRDRQDAYARLQLDPLRPTAEEAFGGAGGDAVDAALRASRGRLGHQAMPALAARPEHVEEGDEAAGRQGPALHVAQRAVGLEDEPAVDVARDDRVGHPRQPTVMEVDVRAAHLAGHHLQHGAAGLRAGRGEAAHLERLPGTRHHDRADGSSQHSAISNQRCKNNPCRGAC